MPQRILTALMAFLALAGATGAGAQSLSSLRAQEADDQRLAAEVAYTNSVCGGSLSARIDWISAALWTGSDSLAGACDGALGALETICRADGGAARGGKLTSFVCAGDGAGPSIRGSSFRYGASPGGDSYSDALAYLEGAL